MTRCTRPTVASARITPPTPTGSSASRTTRCRQKRAEADSLFHRVGITFAVYGEQEGNERLIPFDIVPRVLSARNGGRWRRACGSACGP